MILPGLLVLPLVIAGSVIRIVGIDIDIHSGVALDPIDTIDTGCRFERGKIGQVVFPISGTDAQPILRRGAERQGVHAVDPVALCRKGIDRIVVAFYLYLRAVFRRNGRIAGQGNGAAQ